MVVNFDMRESRNHGLNKMMEALQRTGLEIKMKPRKLDSLLEDLCVLVKLEKIEKKDEVFLSGRYRA